MDFFDDGHSAQWYSMVVSLLAFLIISDAEHLSCFWAICAFFGKVHLFFSPGPRYLKDYLLSLSAIACRGVLDHPVFAGLLWEELGEAVPRRLWVPGGLQELVLPMAAAGNHPEFCPWCSRASTVAAQKHSGWISCCSIWTRLLLWPRTPYSHNFLNLLGCNLWLPGRSLLALPWRGRCTNEIFQGPSGAQGSDECTNCGPPSILPSPWGLDLRDFSSTSPSSVSFTRCSIPHLRFFFFQNTSNFTYGTEVFHKHCVGRETHSL